MESNSTLTDEELTKVESLHRLNPALYGRGDRCSWCFSGWPCDTSRLIAALRASQDKIKELEQNQVTHEFDEETGYCLCTCCRHGI